MDSNSTTNLLLFILTLIWGAKIGYHFEYIKRVKNDEKSSFVLFLLNIENLLYVIELLLPFFIRRKDDSEVSIKLKRKVVLFTWLFCLYLLIVCLYFYFN